MTINIGRVNEGNLQQEIIDAYKSLRSFAGIALPDPLNTTTSVTLPAANVNGTFSIIHLAAATEGGGVRGSSFTANTDGTITCNKDMFAVSVTCYAKAKYGTNSDAVLGVGIGNPTQIPNKPGLQVGENYVSRFQYSSFGRGNNRPVTLLTPYEPVGKSTTELNVDGVKVGDKLFPVMWTTDTEGSVTLTLTDLIFTVQEISI
ncbi:hypothetical protein [Vibrio phage JSF13]|jgi:hypothetical protein|nr:hypothetical protein [Vibrio phage JSF13]ASV42328.1 hypothetical protein [Vibrio phage JSF14]ASV42543.1 hypothetical protein [Vibrio phage JSF17]AXY82210.1 hypothetical protein ICP12011A_116 [Vibrio phage ICP1_2011_A]AXY82429.1 hypothetical protein ICP12011B_113 [Vibrio phage ICP1_2011_B]QVV99331.1 hypothetical protein 2015DhaA_0565 [Vibrio phage ICP1]HAS3707715.1 hypothetical protein [Vibrio cholerae]